MKNIMLNNRTFLHRLKLTATWSGETIAILQHNATDIVQRNLVFQEVYHQSWTSFLPSLEGGKSVYTFEIEIEMLKKLELLQVFMAKEKTNTGFKGRAERYCIELMNFLSCALREPHTILTAYV